MYSEFQGMFWFQLVCLFYNLPSDSVIYRFNVHYTCIRVDVGSHIIVRFEFTLNLLYLHIQVRKEPDVQELRQWQSEWREENGGIKRRVSDFWEKQMPESPSVSQDNLNKDSKPEPPKTPTDLVN